MPSRAALEKYWHIALIAAEQAAAGRVALFGRVVFHAIILVIFSRLWRVAFAETPHVGFSNVDLTWYMTVTEWVALSVPQLFVDIEQDVRGGDLATQLARPCSYIGAQIAKGLGTGAVYLMALIVFTTPIVFFLAGGWPQLPLALVGAAVLAAMAMGLSVLVSAMIGLGAFWLTDASPLHWIWQKLLFVFGGLILPLSFYPEQMQRIAHATPFYAILSGPASLVMAPSAVVFRTAALRLLVWSALGALALVGVNRRAHQVLNINGG